MKRIILAVFTVFAFATMNAQDGEGSGGFSKGDVFASGSLSLSSVDDKNFDDKFNMFMFMPRVGFFLSENIAAGVEVGFGSSKNEVGGSTTFETSTFGFGAFGRYYFTPADKFSLFGSLGIGYSSLKLEPAGSPDSKVNTTSATLGLGFNYFVAQNFSLEVFAGALSYSSSKADTSGAEAVNSFGFGGDWNNVTVGVNYRF